MAVDSTAIILGRIFYFLLSQFSKKSKSSYTNLKFYIAANSIRYSLLILANIFNSAFYFITGFSIYLIISILFSLLIFAYKFSLSVFKKEFTATDTEVSLEIGTKYF